MWVAFARRSIVSGMWVARLQLAFQVCGLQVARISLVSGMWVARLSLAFQVCGLLGSH